MSLQSLSFRLMAGHSDAKRDRGLNTAPDDILRINDIPYGPDVKWSTEADMYTEVQSSTSFTAWILRGEDSRWSVSIIIWRRSLSFPRPFLI